MQWPSAASSSCRPSRSAMPHKSALPHVRERAHCLQEHHAEPAAEIYDARVKIAAGTDARRTWSSEQRNGIECLVKPG
jgi:imidazolonepropionase-like amidohydrolase